MNTETKDAAKHATMHRTALMAKNDPVQSVNSVEVKKSYCKLKQKKKGSDC